MEPGQDREARVGRAVVDENDLDRLSPWFECGRDLVVQLLERALLVEQRNDDRDHDTEGIGLSGRCLQRGWTTTTPSGTGGAALSSRATGRRLRQERQLDQVVRRRRGGDRERDGGTATNVSPAPRTPNAARIGKRARGTARTRCVRGRPSARPRAPAPPDSSCRAPAGRALRRTALPPGAGLRTATASSRRRSARRREPATSSSRCGTLRCRPGASGEKEREQAAGQNRHRARVDAELDSLGRCARGQ